MAARGGWWRGAKRCVTGLTLWLALGLSLGALGCESDSGSKTNTTPGAGQDAMGGDARPEDTVSSGDGAAAVGTCTCETPGATLDSTCDWPDAEECSGWVSITVENDPALKAQEEAGDFEGAMAAAAAKTFPSGTELCAFECCTTITCP